MRELIVLFVQSLNIWCVFYTDNTLQFKPATLSVLNNYMWLVSEEPMFRSGHKNSPVDEG